MRYAASQYGSIWYTRDTDSIIQAGGEGNNGSLFSATIETQCQAQAGALNYTSVEDCANFQGIGYVIQYNFTGLHTGPLFQTLADQALARYATNNPNIVITTTIAPLRITRIEKGFGQAEDATLAWILVSLITYHKYHCSSFLMLFFTLGGVELSFYCRRICSFCKSALFNTGLVFIFSV